MWDLFHNADNPYHNDQNNPYGQNTQNPYTNQPNRPASSKPNGDSLSMAAMILGILSIAMTFMLMFQLALIFGSIGIILALLSKGRAPRIAGKAKTGIICSTAGLVMTAMICTTTLTVLYTHPEVMDQVNDLFEQQYGMSYEEIMKTLLDSGTFSPD